MKKALFFIMIFMLLTGCNKQEIEKEKIKQNPYYQQLMNNNSLVAENETTIYFVNDFEIYSMDKQTKQIDIVLNHDMFSNKNNALVMGNLMVYNKDLYFIAIEENEQQDFSRYEVNLYVLKEKNNKIEKIVEIINRSGVFIEDNYIYYQVEQIGNFSQRIIKYARYNLLTNKSEILDGLDCTYLYSDQENMLCLNQVKDNNFELSYLNKETFDSERIKLGLFSNTIVDYKPMFLDNAFYYYNYSNIDFEYLSGNFEIGKIDLIANEEIIYDLETYLEDEEKLVTFNVDSNKLYITTEIQRRFSTEQKEDYTTINRLYYFENNELTKVFEGYSNEDWSYAEVSVSEDYAFFWLMGNSEYPEKIMKIFDHQGSEVKIIK